MRLSIVPLGCPVTQWMLALAAASSSGPTTREASDSRPKMPSMSAGGTDSSATTVPFGACSTATRALAMKIWSGSLVVTFW
jgi:hypothetical protein